MPMLVVTYSQETISRNFVVSWETVAIISCIRKPITRVNQESSAIWLKQLFWLLSVQITKGKPERERPSQLENYHHDGSKR